MTLLDESNKKIYLKWSKDNWLHITQVRDRADNWEVSSIKIPFNCIDKMHSELTSQLFEVFQMEKIKEDETLAKIKEP